MSSGASALWGARAPNGSRSSIITEGQAMARIRTHPGEVLREELMKSLGLSANALPLALRVPATRIGDILCTKKPRAVTADTAIRLARHFGTTEEFWRGRGPPSPCPLPRDGGQVEIGGDRARRAAAGGDRRYNDPARALFRHRPGILARPNTPSPCPLPSDGGEVEIGGDRAGGAAVGWPGSVGEGGTRKERGGCAEQIRA